MKTADFSFGIAILAWFFCLYPFAIVYGFYKKCRKSIISCSRTCGQAVPSPVPADLELECTKEEGFPPHLPARANIFKMSRVLVQTMCKAIDAAGESTGEISNSNLLTLSACKAENLDKDNIDALNVDEMQKNGNKLFSKTGLVNSSGKVTFADILKEIDKKLTLTYEQKRALAEVAAHPLPDLKNPAAWTGYSVPFGDSKIGVANSDLFLMMNSRFERLSNEME